MQSDSQGDAYGFEKLKLSQALIFGDSWTKKFLTPTWPQMLAKKLKLTAHNFGVEGSRTTDLHRQVTAALRSRRVKRDKIGFDPDTIAIVHSGGNDLQAAIVKNSRTAIAELRASGLPAKERNILSTLKLLYENGVRSFIVSDIPSSWNVPQNRLMFMFLHHMLMETESRAWLDVEHGDSPKKVARQVSLRMHAKMALMLRDFRTSCPEAKVLHFNENAAVDNIKSSIGRLRMLTFWQDLLHPNWYGHAKITEEVHACTSKLSTSSMSVVCPV
jgi:hypothetical protein